jgi:peptidylprolyl isomerase
MTDTADPALPGEVVEGLDLVKKIESLGTASGATKGTITIAASGTV